MGPPGRGLDPGIADETSLENGYFEATPYEPFAAEGQGEIPEGYEPAQRTWGEDQRPYAPRPAGDGAGAKRFGIVFAIVALVVALVAIAAYRLRDRPEDSGAFSGARAGGPGRGWRERQDHRPDRGRRLGWGFLLERRVSAKPRKTAPCRRHPLSP